MAAKKSKSKKRSGANYGSQQPLSPAFFIDKSLGLSIVPNALRAAGERVELKTDHFDEDTLDQDWLPEVGGHGWVILSKDKAISRNFIEILQLLRAGTHSFILTSGNATGRQMADAFLKALPQIKNIIARFEPPLVAIVSANGTVRIKWTHDSLIKFVSERRAP